uniref:TOG domain-containing protein n=1 Tax=Ciona savignyi TaxID=51511 RepID=H2ZRB1_CIOSA
LEHFVTNVRIDLSRHGLAIAKMLAPQLTSKMDAIRDGGCDVIRAMASQCSDAESVLEMVQYLFQVLKGSEVKLTLPGQKSCVLRAIGGLNGCAVSRGSSSDNLASTIVALFIGFLQQENHEGTLCIACSALGDWCTRVSTIQAGVVEHLVKSIKQSPPSVRMGYIQVMLKLFKRDNISAIEPLIPQLLQAVEKGRQQPTQVVVSSEAIGAALLCSKLDGVEFKKEHKLTAYHEMRTDSKMSWERVLQHGSDDVLKMLAQLMEAWVVDGEAKLVRFYKILVHLFVCKPRSVHQTVAKLLKRLITAEPGKLEYHTLVTDLRCELLSEIFTEMRPLLPSDSNDNDDSTKSHVTPRRLIAAIKCVLTVETDPASAKSVVMAMLADVYHPYIVKENNHIWTDYLYNNGIDARKFIEENVATVLNALSDIVRIAPDIMMPHVTQYLSAKLGQDELSQVTQHEYGVMLTPDGTLFNVSVISSAPRIVENKNVKRESKNYSFKEQLMGEELQREIEAKKRGKGGVKGAGVPGEPLQPLNKKQREVYEAEMEREKVIRAKMMQLNAEFQKVCEVLSTIIAVQTNEISQHLVVILRPLLLLSQSPLCSEQSQRLFVALSDVMVPEQLSKLGVQTAYATLRLLQPAQQVDEAWCFEDLNDNTQKNLKTSLYPAQPAPCTAYITPFLHRVCSTQDPDLINQSLRLILTQLGIRYDGVMTFHPRLLPRLDIMRNAGKLIGTSMVQIQRSACQVLLATCEAGSGEEGCATAECEEINFLLDSLLSPVAMLRGGLLILRGVIPSSSGEMIAKVTRRAWVAMHDVDDDNKKLGKELWEIMGFQLEPSMCCDVLEDVQHHESAIQQASAESLFVALDSNKDFAPDVCQRLFDIYNLKLEELAPVIDELGRTIVESSPDQFNHVSEWLTRSMTISHCDTTISQAQRVFSFFVPYALGDRNAQVASKMLEAALQSVNDHGKENTEILLQVFEDFLKNAPTSESYDAVRQSVVILLGTLARHLDKDHPKVKPIVAKLTETLSTPSQAVQESVANCLPALVPSIRDDAPNIVRKLLEILLESEKYGERKGAAYGLAGMVKGLGIISFKQLNIMSTLTEAIQDKKNFRHREGALLSFEMFCGMLGRLFEPYIVHVLPHLLLCFGDGNQYVRLAADNTARAVMRNLSAHGVRLVLPSLLSALRAEDSWRTKTGSAELLGAMAYCAPKQLSSCLPSIVPKLCEVLNDSHPKVLKAGQQALKQIGSVIRNPEIQAISDSLLSALSDPARKTSSCLHTLLNTKFIHFIDAPSLALILPVVERAFLDRSTDTRKMAAQIIGNMYSLTDHKDLSPYLPAIIPGLQNTLLDPVPEVRAIAAKALGAMVKGTGESQFEELLPWLMEKLTTENSAVLASLGVDKLSKLMPEVIRTAGSDSVLPHVRDGYIMLFVYLPCTFGDQFVPFIGQAIFPILQALADECEYVRTTALLAGRRIITMFAETAIEVLLPQLEQGLFDDNWRIRLSSIQLLGDLLYHVSGVTGKMSAAGEEDDNFGTAEGFKAIVDILGQERRDLVLSGLYMGRSDVALLVRQSALHVWKIIVPNTPRVLREILPTLFNLLLGCLASKIYDKRQVAAKTLGDIVRKLGERMLPELIPILERGLDSDDEDQREGVCIGLSEIIKSCSKDAIIVFTDNLVPTVRKALCDELPRVREAAATTFEHLHNTIGVQALDEILPALLRQLNDPKTSDNAVDGLRQIISVKGRVVLPFIVPKLIEPPVDTHVLAFLSSVAGEALTRHLSVILKALVQALTVADDFESVKTDAIKVLHSVSGEHGMRIVVDDMLAGVKQDDAETRFASIVLLHGFCTGDDAEYSDYISVFLQALIKLLADPDQRVQMEAWDTLSVVTGTLDPVGMHRHVSSVRHALRFVRNDEVVTKTGILPGFCLPKRGMAPLLSIFREAILNGHPELKEQAAKGISECIQYLTPAALKPSVVSITGPLIRILGDRFSSNVRIAVLETLSNLLEKVGVFLKPFLPQLQTTFSKALQDTSRPVRIQAGVALAHLSSIHARVDPLFTELNTNIRNTDDVSLRETHLFALRGCIGNGGSKMGDKVRDELLNNLTSQLSLDDDVARLCASGCLGNLCAVMPDSEVTQLMTQQILATNPSDPWSLKQGRSSLLAAALKEAPNKVLQQNRTDKVVEIIRSSTSSDRVQIVISAIHSAAYLLHYFIKSGLKIPDLVSDCFKNVSSTGCQVCLCRSLVSFNNYDVTVSIIPEPIIVRWVSLLLALTREKNTTVRSTAESSIVVLLQLRHSEALLNKTTSSLPTRDANSLTELHKLKLKRIASMTETMEDIDNTIIR